MQFSKISKGALPRMQLNILRLQSNNDSGGFNYIHKISMNVKHEKTWEELFLNENHSNKAFVIFDSRRYSKMSSLRKMASQ